MDGNLPPIWDAKVYPELQYDAYRIVPPPKINNFPSTSREICDSLLTFASSMKTKSAITQPLISTAETRKEFNQNRQTIVDNETNHQPISTLSVLMEKLDVKKLQFLPSIQTLAKNLRKAKTIRERNMNNGGCVFCKNNNEPIDFVRDHQVRDASGKVTCPILRTFKCPICGETGDQAHTLKYCPQKPIITMRDTELAEYIGRAFQERTTLCK